MTTTPTGINVHFHRDADFRTHVTDTYTALNIGGGPDWACDSLSLSLFFPNAAAAARFIDALRASLDAAVVEARQKLPGPSYEVTIGERLFIVHGSRIPHAPATRTDPGEEEGIEIVSIVDAATHEPCNDDDIAMACAAEIWKTLS